jgi:hypothetical protein
VHTINLDASSWNTGLDFYDAILPALGAPDWHGRNANALVESIVWGEINAIEPPYRVRVTNLRERPQRVQEEVGWIEEGVAEGKIEFKERRGRDVDVGFEIVS